MRLKDRVAVVTGAAGGFGEGIARAFAAEGAKVVIADLNAEAGEKVAKSLGANATFLRTDVSSEANCQAAIKAAVSTFGGLDILVNNAGYCHNPKAVVETTEAEFDLVYAVNVKAIAKLTRHALEPFKARGGGVIINIASIAQVRPRPGSVAYAASKAATSVLTKGLALELATSNIRVCGINPVAGETNMLSTLLQGGSEDKLKQVLAGIPLGRLAKPADIAGAAVFLASDEASMITGSFIDVDGGRGI